MTVQVILLALASTIRPTSLAAVYALVSGDAPRRLMTVYVAAGLAFTVSFGLLVIWVLSGVDIGTGTNRARGIAEIGGGILVLVFALGVLSGRVGGPRSDDAPRPTGRRWDQLLVHRPTQRTAALAGPVTHIPGVFYLIALNVVIAYHAAAPRELLAVLTYNAIWFALPLGALAVCVVEPDAARQAIGAIQRWTSSHSRTLLLGASLVVGCALIVRGALTV